MPVPSIEQIEKDFAVLDDWEDRYKYIIELGRELPPFEDSFKIPDNKVQGCASQVWLKSIVKTGPGGEATVHYAGDSDAHIVRGLIAIAFALFSGQTAQHILALDTARELQSLQLSEHLTPQRSNGFASLISRIKNEARLALGGKAN